MERTRPIVTDCKGVTLRSLRRLMHNSSNQQIGQVAQRTTELDIEPLPAGVGCDFGSQTSQQPLQGLGPVALQGEEVLELVYDPLDDLAFSGCPTTVGF